MITALKRLYFVGAYYLSWVLFITVGLVLNFVSLPMLLLPHRELRGRGMRATIRWLFDFWLRWFHASGVVRINWHGFDRPLDAGTVYIANHPTLVDATILLARLPDAICIFKPALMRNPAVGPPAIMAGYVAGRNAVDTVREVADKVGAGSSLLIFPEGTRTSPGAALEPLKPGFALMAQLARAPVQLLVIRSTAGLVPRGRPWWRAPAVLPAVVDISLDRRWEHDDARSVTQLTAEVEQHLLDRLRPSGNA